MERIAVAFASQEAQNRIARLLESNGCVLAGCFFTGADTIRAVHKLNGAIVVCGFKLRDMTAGDLAFRLRGEAALLVVSTAANLELCEGENLYKLATPTSRSEFFASLELIRNTAGPFSPPPPHRREEEKQLIERAKALLMEINRMSEAEAHRFLQKRSMDTGRRMVETAQLVIDSYAY